MVARAERLGQHVLDARRFDDRTHAATGDDAGTGRRRTQQHAATTELAHHLVRDRVLVHGHFDHRLAGGFGSLADRFGDLVGLAEPAAYLAVVVTRDDQRAERETASTFDDLGASVDEHDLFGRFAAHGCRALVGVALAVAAATISAGLLAWRHKRKESENREF